MFTAGTVIAERFRLERVLGQGGMGAVWVAHHLGLDIPCAVKFIHPEVATSAELRARFEREARSAAQLRSPHVVQVLDHGVWNDVPYIAMELLEGEDLSARLGRLGRLEPQAILAIVAQVARALTKAHAASLVHRDLKPENIFLARDDDREIVKVLDFGIAKSNAMEGAGGGTRTGSLIGTPHYMSPEQARGLKGIDHRADLWALAVIVYQCLTGVRPFENEALGDLLMQIITHQAPVPSAVAEVPPGFDAWWARATAQKRTQRFESARELSDALAVALGVSGSAIGELGLGTPVAVGMRREDTPGDALVRTVATPASPAPGTPTPPQPTTAGGGPGNAPATVVFQGGSPMPGHAAPALTSGGMSSPVAMPGSGARPKRGAGVGVVVALVVVALGGGSAYLALRSGGAARGGAATEEQRAPSLALPDPVAPVSPAASGSAAPPAVTPAADAPPPASAAPADSAAITPRALAAPGGPAALPLARKPAPPPSAQPSAAPRRRADFGI